MEPGSIAAMNGVPPKTWQDSYSDSSRAGQFLRRPRFTSAVSSPTYGTLTVFPTELADAGLPSFDYDPFGASYALLGRLGFQRDLPAGRRQYPKTAENTDRR